MSTLPTTRVIPLRPLSYFVCYASNITRLYPSLPSIRVIVLLLYHAVIVLF